MDPFVIGEEWIDAGDGPDKLPSNTFEIFLLDNGVDPLKYYRTITQIVIEKNLPPKEAVQKFIEIIEKFTSHDDRLEELQKLLESYSLDEIGNIPYENFVQALKLNEIRLTGNANNFRRSLEAIEANAVLDITEPIIDHYDFKSVGHRNAIERDLRTLFTADLNNLTLQTDFEIKGLTKEVEKDNYKEKINEKYTYLLDRLRSLQLESNVSNDTINSSRPYPIDVNFLGVSKWPLSLLKARHKRWSFVFHRELKRWQVQALEVMKNRLIRRKIYQLADGDMNLNIIRHNALVWYQNSVTFPITRYQLEHFLPNIAFFSFPITVEELKEHLFTYLNLKMNDFRDELSFKISGNKEELLFYENLLREYADEMYTLWFDEWIGIMEDANKPSFNPYVRSKLLNLTKPWLAKISDGIKAENVKTDKVILETYSNYLKSLEDIISYEYGYYHTHSFFYGTNVLPLEIVLDENTLKC